MDQRRKLLTLFLLCGLVFSVASQCRSGSSVDNSANPITFSSGQTYGLVYFSKRGNANSFGNRGFGGLYLTNLTTRHEQTLTSDNAVSQNEGFSWSPITRQLVFSGRGKNGTQDSNLFALDLDGNYIQLTNDDTYDSRGLWSPDGRTIAFKSIRPDNYMFYLMDIDGSNVRPVFNEDREFLLGNEFVWAPNSQRLAVSIIPYVDSKPMNLDAPLTNIMIVDVEPTKSSLPLPGDRIRANFDWSYDSNKLVYLSDPVAIDSLVSVYKEMYVYDTKTNEEIMVAGFKGGIGTPVWSPAEDVIAFSAVESEKTDEINIYLINGDGTGLKKLTDGGAYRVAAWSPDGNKLAVEIIGETLSDSEIGVLDIETGTLEQITNNNVFDAFPLWVEL